MKWLNINVPLGVSETPIGFSRKSQGAGAALGAVGDMLYGIWNTYETNDSNERIAKNTNDANERINESQLAWAREQYELEKEENRFLVNQAYGRELENRNYNSPVNEMQRLRAAGLNPYLAKYGNGASGGSGSISAQVGQNPHANQPSVIPMQTGAPMIPNSHGLGLSQAVHDYYLAKESERADYALAADITFRDRKAILDSLNYLLDVKKEGANEKWINSQIDHLLRADRLEQDKLSHQREVDSFNAKMEEFNAETQRLNAKTSQMLARSQIRVNNATIAQISSNIASTRLEVAEMLANGVSKRKIESYIAMREKENLEIIKSDLQFRKDFYGEPGNRDLFQRMTYGLKAFGETMFSPIRNLVGAAPK